MFTKTRLIGAAVMLLTLFVSNFAVAGITTIVRGGTQPAEPNCAPALAGSALAENAVSYCDRDYDWRNVTGTAVDGAEYVIPANDDKDIDDYTLTVTVDAFGTLYLLWNDLVGPLPQWATDLGFTDTTEDIQLFTDGNNPNFSIYSIAVSAGDITMYGANDSNSAIYTVAFVPSLVDVEVGIVDIPDPVIAGSGDGNFTLTFSATNNGPDEATNVVVVLSSAGITPGAASFAGPPTVPAGTIWADPNWTIPSLASGETLELIIPITLDETQESGVDIITWTSTASVDQTDTDTGNNTIQESTSVEAAADGSSTFTTSITFSNGFEGSVEITLTCNAGIPLSQDAQLSADGDIQFSVNVLDFVKPDTTCEIALSGLNSGYTAMAMANGEDTGASCVFAATPVATESAPFDPNRANTCVFTAEPMPSNFSVDIDWMDVDDGSISQAASVILTCFPASSNTGSVFGTVSNNFYGMGDQTYSLDFYPTTADTGTLCEVIVNEDSLDSAVEPMVSCGEDGTGIVFNIGDEEGECSVTLTAFFEGIPTLSQYGMAIMVLLMLGVGFVGFRRFV